MPGLTTITEEARPQYDLEEGEFVESDLEEGEIREVKPKEANLLKPSVRANKEGSWYPSRPTSPNPKARYDPYRGRSHGDRDWTRTRNKNTNTSSNVRNLDTWWRGGEQRAAPSEFIPTRTRTFVTFADNTVGSSRLGDWLEKKKMTVSGYARMVDKLRTFPYRRAVGAGTNEDPRIMWMCNANLNPEGRAEAIERICRNACKEKGVTKIWIRKEDHRTTRTFAVTRTGAKEVEKTVSMDDPHFTVYMGDGSEYLYEGHIYVGYNGPFGVPTHIAETSERKFMHPGHEEAISLLDRSALREKAMRMGVI
ncbi:uncharacterized protein BDV14DRAFT_202385 [Aspergillus stella-maris]|uniref:uncharacterized protein n=1 Tax=Aspergillus stella-maris TaxID=1810926 RepID=UPI003CCD886F